MQIEKRDPPESTVRKLPYYVRHYVAELLGVVLTAVLLVGFIGVAAEVLVGVALLLLSLLVVALPALVVFALMILISPHEYDFSGDDE